MNGVRILVLADTQDERETLERALAPRYAVETVAAAEAAQAAASQQPPGLVVAAAADTGAFLRGWRADPDTRDVPVLCVTNGAVPDDADDSLSRPLDPRLVAVRVQTLLRLRRGANAQSNQAVQALREEARHRDRFLATLAHELRNPLAPIRNALEILRTADASAADAAYARDLLERQVRQMVRLIDDLLDVSRLRVGKIDLRRERVALDDVVNAALETCRPALDAAGHALTVSLAPEPVVLDGDPLRLAQVLANLLLNAAKYTAPGGRIGLAAAREGDRVAIRVCDSGAGIRPEQLPHVFEMFRKPVAAGIEGQGGLGVGLGLVKALVEQHGGTVAARSDGLGMGSEFTVRLPMASGPAAPRPASALTAPARAPGCRVLVVDDSLDAARSLARLLRLGGHEVRTAHDGPAAVDAFVEFAPEVVFLDIGMPIMDGYEVARRIRALPSKPPVLLVAVTGWGQEEDRRRSRAAGIDVHLVKPVEPDQLRELLARGTDKGANG